MKSLSLLAIALAATVTNAADRLPALKLEPSITVSGISSGAYMASQFHLAHSGQVTGVALIAGGPYGCAGNSLSAALAGCVDKATDMAPISTLVEKAKKRMQAGELAPLATNTSDKVWVFHGSKDDRVAKAVTDASVQFYREIGAGNSLQYVEQIPAAHGFPTLATGAGCGVAESPWLNACNYDAAGELLRFLLGELQAPSAQLTGTLQTFSQEQYAPDEELTLADEGYVYIPASCAKGESCRLHVAFHGCQQNADAVGERFVREAGYNRWADSNRLVVLYPQTRSSYVPLNPKACWDWWGYTDEHYDTRAGNQIRTVQAMIQALSGK